MIQLIVDGERRTLNKEFVFNGGEVHVELITFPEDKDVTEVTVMAYIKSSEDVMKLAMVKDACDRHFTNAVIKLSLPYFPYARQDRVNTAGEALGAKVMGDMINNMCFSQVTVCDPHSDVVAAVLEDVVVESQDWIFKQHMASHPITGKLRTGQAALVSPDAGALKKTMKLARHYHAKVVVGEKIRDTSTGEITGTVVHDTNAIFPAVEEVIIVDDICDGGRTFTELAKVLKEEHGVKKVGLYVTHGIFSKGKSDLHKKGIDWIVSPFDWEHHETTGRSF